MCTESIHLITRPGIMYVCINSSVIVIMWFSSVNTSHVCTQTDHEFILLPQLIRSIVMHSITVHAHWLMLNDLLFQNALCRPHGFMIGELMSMEDWQWEPDTVATVSICTCLFGLC